MKNLLIITLFLGSTQIFTQTLSLDSGETYAVVVGISDYQDEQIPDLQFADKDALAFAGFLQSPAGGELDGDHLKVLINEQATLAQFAIALDWLMEVTKENDRVIIYFSGHGDVEKKTLTQPGFLLCWDAPARVYMAGGAFGLAYLQEVVSTLSIQTKAKTIVIADACRSGKLSGSKVGGAQLTNSNLAKQYANEIKILSCQPDEYSIEGEQWGGGRGAFSYHLLDGLYGMADGNNDLSVNLLEIGRYLEDHVSTEVAPHSQIPMTVGSRGEKLTTIFPDILAQIKEGKRGQMPLFTATESRGIEDDVLAAVDPITEKIYKAFKRALKEKQFLAPTDACADAYYEILIKEPKMERLHSSMRRNYAAALQDDAQQVLNNWLKTSLDQTMDANKTKGRLPIKVFTEKVRSFPLLLERAAELLGKEHYMYATLQARKHFFEGYLLANSDQNPNKKLGDKALRQFHKALQWQPELPQAYWQMINVYGYNLLQPDSAEVYARKAMNLYPSWIMPYISLTFLFSDKDQQFDRAKPYLEQAMQIDSSSASVRNQLGIYYLGLKEYSEAEKQYKKAIEIDSTFHSPYNNLGNVYWKTRHYDEAEKQYKKAIEIDSTIEIYHRNLGMIYRQNHQYDLAEQAYKKAIRLDSTYIPAYDNLAILYRDTRRYKEEEQTYKKIIRLDSTYIAAYHSLGYLYSATRRYKEEEQAYKKIIRLDSTYIPAYNNLGILYINTRRYKEAEQTQKKGIQIDSTFKKFYNNLGIVYKNTRRYKEAEQAYKKTIRLDSTYWFPYLNLSLLYQILLRWEESEAMMQKAIEYGPPRGLFAGIMGNAYTHLPGRLEDAKREFDKAIKMSPDSPDIYIYLAQWSIKKNQIEEAWKYLEQGLGKGIGNEKLKLSDLQEGPDFEEMRKDPKWTKLLQKYFPDQHKK